MLVGQAEGLELLPEATEGIWGAVSTLMALAPIAAVLLVVWLVRAAWRQRTTGQSVQSLDDRVTHLEAERVESDST